MAGSYSEDGNQKLETEIAQHQAKIQANEAKIRKLGQSLRAEVASLQERLKILTDPSSRPVSGLLRQSRTGEQGQPAESCGSPISAGRIRAACTRESRSVSS